MLSRVRTWIVVLVVSHLVACSSTLTQISPTQPSGAPTGRVGTFLNSPFFLTVVGGLAVAGVTGIYSHLKARNDAKLAKESTIREQQIAVLKSVTDDLPSYVATMASMMSFRQWLDAHDKKSPDVDQRGRSRDEISKLYEGLYTLHLQKRNSTSILAQVDAYYEGQPVCDRVNDEFRAIEKIHDAKNLKEREELLHAEEKVFEGLLTAMAAESGHEAGTRKFRSGNQLGANPQLARLRRRIDRKGLPGPRRRPRRTSSLTLRGALAAVPRRQPQSPAVLDERRKLRINLYVSLRWNQCRGRIIIHHRSSSYTLQSSISFCPIARSERLCALCNSRSENSF